jgi:acetyl-CoA acetyltransferase
MTDAFVLGGVRTPVGRYGVLGVCVGSGQGVALVLENPKVA